MSESRYYECCRSHGTHTAACDFYHGRSHQPASLGSPETPQESGPRVTDAMANSAARFNKLFVPITYEPRDGDTLAVRMCKKIYNLTHRGASIGPDELRTIHSAAFAGLEGEDEIDSPLDSPPETPQEDAAPPPVVRNDWRIDHRGDLVWCAKVLRKVPTLDEAVTMLGNVVRAAKQPPPSLLAAPEGRVRQFLQDIRPLVIAASESSHFIDGFTIGDDGLPRTKPKRLTASDDLLRRLDELEAALAPLAEPPKETS